MDITTTIPDKRIAQLLCTGFEGGVGYWCRIMKTKAPEKSVVRKILDADNEDGQIWPYYDYPLLEGGAVICRRYEEETDRKYTPLTLDLAAISRGLQLMSEKYPHHYGNFIADNEDAITGDVFIQLCLLGDVEYG